MILVSMPSPSRAVNRSNYDYTRGEVLMGDTEEVGPHLQDRPPTGLQDHSVGNNYHNERAQLGQMSPIPRNLRSLGGVEGNASIY